MLPNE
ncbi:f59e9a8e-556e-4438-be27-e4efe6aa1b52 [Thermothielavioides terrestris]